MKTFISFLILCLIATCNAELRKWTAINGKEVEAEFVSNEKGIVKLKLKSGKSFEVPANKLSKKDNEFISSLAKPEGVNLKELDLREGIIYLKGSETPYAGKVSALYENGQMKAEVNYKDGKREGLTIGWYKNGQKKSEENYKGGKPDGLVFGWYENGKKKVEGNFKKGKQYGLHVMWYENEQKEFEANFKDGKCEGLVEEWHENGQKKWEANCKEGKPVKGSEKFWNSKGVSVDTVEEAEAEAE